MGSNKGQNENDDEGIKVPRENIWRQIRETRLLCPIEQIKIAE